MLSRRHTKGISIPANHDHRGELLRHLGMFTQLTDEGIATFDLKGTIHFVNRAWAKMHGYKSSDELLGKKISLFHTKDQMKSDVIPFIEETKREGSATDTIEHVRKDGTIFPTQMKTSLLRDEKGQANGLIVIIKDITEHKRFEEAATGPGKQEKELKEQIEQLQQQLGEQEKVKEDLKQQAAELMAVNEKLQHQIAEHEQAEESLKQDASKIKTTNEQFHKKITEHEQNAESLKQEVARLTTTNEQLQQKITEHEKAEESLKQKADELTAANEKLKDKIIEKDLTEESQKQETTDLKASNKQLKNQITELEQAGESLKQEIDELKAANEQLKNQITERDEKEEEKPRKTTKSIEESEQMGRLLDTEQLKSIAELAKRLR